MPSMISFKRSAVMPKGASAGCSARVTGCCGLPANSPATSCRHQASLVAASCASAVSSTTSSTSRQNAYSAVIARRRSGGRNRNE